MTVVTEVNNKPTVGGIMRPVNSRRLCEVFTGRLLAVWAVSFALCECSSVQALLVDEAYFAALGHKGFGVTRGRVWPVCMVGGRDNL